jgi:imidazolonepropionase-like amidohydrolase
VNVHERARAVSQDRRRSVGRLAPAALALFAGLVPTAGAWAGGPANPSLGLRESRGGTTALVGATVYVTPERRVEGATLLVVDGRVAAVGTDVEVPAGATVVDLAGRFVYPGFVEPWSEYGLGHVGDLNPKKEGRESREIQYTRAGRGARSWNDAVHAERRWADAFQPDAEAAAKLLERGVTSALTIRRDGVFRGRAAVVSLAEGRAGERVLSAAGPHGLSFEKGSSKQAYPSSEMGAIALVRQTLMDAEWWPRAEAAWRRDPTQARPEVDAAVAALAADLHGAGRPAPVFFETSGEATALRAAAIGRELDLPLVHVVRALAGGGRFDQLAALDVPLVVPISLPDTPDVGTVEAERLVTLAELRAWDRAPSLAAELVHRGVEFAFTGSGLREGEDALDAARARVRRGLPAARALAALTTVPARLAGVEEQVGSLERGRRADLIVADGELLPSDAASTPGRLLAVWIDGRPARELEPLDGVDLRGRWTLTLDGRALVLELTGERRSKVEGKLAPAAAAPPSPENPPADPAEPGDAAAASGAGAAKSAKLEGVEVRRDRVSFRVDLSKIGGEGVARFVVARPAPGGAAAAVAEAEVARADGRVERVELARTGDAEAKPDDAAAERAESEAAPPAARRTFPDAPFGSPERPRAETVLVRGATVWTMGPAGRLEGADLLVREGKVAAVGRGLAAPAGARVVEAAGRHVTPGLIDEHSHLAIDGGVNEGSHPVTSEVRIEDVIDPDDVGLYRALAGGTTAAQLLHGSANPIGGQAVVIKHRWGATADGLRLADVTPTIKFALGENVKQSNWTDPGPRYPKTRMGVEARIRDAFLAAREAAAARRRWEALAPGERSRRVPPRRDLQLEPLIEILEGRRNIHCHSYVQSEVLALIRLADELGFEVHTFTHILEGYKVAPEMAAHGAGGSSFADWWAYKFEVYDAIPQNVCLMREAGIVTSVNSDSSEMIRRLNQEASKGVLYCGMDEVAALEMATLAPARQLEIDDRVGSLEPGKDGDFVIWSGHPLSTQSRVEETWIEGARYFSRERDAELRAADAAERRALVAKALAAPAPKKKSKGEGRRDERPAEGWHCDDLGAAGGAGREEVEHVR